MQEAVPIGEGAMLVILGKEVENVEKILIDKNLKCYHYNFLMLSRRQNMK